MGSGNNAVEALIYLKEWIYRKRSSSEDGEIVYTYHYIKDIPTLLELENFTIDGNFDRISSLRLYPYANKLRLSKKLHEVTKDSRYAKSIYEEIGLYGYKDN